MTESVNDKQSQTSLGTAASDNMINIKVKRNLPILFISMFLYQIHFISGVLVPFFTDWGGITITQTMILQSIFTGGIFAFEIPMGILSDLIGRKKTLILSYLVNAVAVVVYSSAPVFGLFVIGELTWACAAALQSGAIDAMLYDSLKKIGREQESKKISGKMHSMGLLGIIISAPIGSVIAAVWGLQFTMRSMAVPMILAGVIALFLTEPYPEFLINGKNKQQRTSGFVLFSKGLKNLVQTPALRRIVLDYTLVAWVGYFIIWFYQLRLEDAGIPLLYFGWVSSGFTITEALFMNNFVPLEKLVRSKRRLLILSTLLIGLGYLTLGLTTIPILVIIGATICVSLSFGRQVLSVNYMNKFISTENRATVLSTVSMGRMFGIMLLNPLMGWLAEKSLVWVLISLGIVGISLGMISPIKEDDLID